ncbi:MAG TPA: alkaline phosphatase [bacterium]|nr:alkaline phosphatase [bacterium]HPN46064.1 alkaline phosphatase [bacterium]
MQKIKTILQILLCSVIFFSANSFAEKNPRNIILLIGDGMGVAHVTAAKTVNGTLNMERMTGGGLSVTYSANNYVTDSAAGGTALATGTKTYNGAISVSPDTLPVKTVCEFAEEKGKATGLVVTCTFTNATPASFFAHVAKRSMENEIAAQLANSGIDVVFGGGWGFLVPKSVEKSRRKDDLDLLTGLEKKMLVIRTPEEFAKLGSPKQVAGFFAAENLPQAKERSVSLADMTSKAIQLLAQNSKGFFLMVEGSQIDWGGHNNNAEYLINEVIDFDAAIGAALDFAEKNKNTLVVVTADHETGGLTLLEGSIPDKKVSKPAFSTGNHSATMVPLLVYGPGSQVLGGIHDNTFIGKTLIEFVKK